MIKVDRDGVTFSSGRRVDAPGCVVGVPLLDLDQDGADSKARLPSPDFVYGGYDYVTAVVDGDDFQAITHSRTRKRWSWLST